MRRGVQRLWSARWLPAAIATVPLLWLVTRELTNFGHDTAVCCDWAVLQLQTDRAGRLEVMTGAYSRYGWHHPGPAAFYLAAPFHRLAGSDFVGLTVAAAVANAVWVFVVVHLLRLRLGAAAGWTACLVLLVFLWGMGLNRMSDPWNPLLVILPAAVVAVSAACAADGMRWALPVAVLAGSMAVQSHVGSAPTVGAMALGGTVLVAPVAWKDRRAWVPALLGSAAVLVLVWVPPAIEQLTEEPGNLGSIVAFARAGHEGQTWSDAVDVVAVQLGLGVDGLGDHLIGGRQLPPFSTGRRVLAAGQLLLLVGAVVVSWRRAQRVVLSLGLVVAAGAAGALWGATRVTGLLEAYLTAAAIGVGLAAYLAIALAATELGRSWWRGRDGDPPGHPSRLLLKSAVLAGAVGLALVAIRPQLGTAAWSSQMSNQNLESLDGVIERELGPGDRVVYVDFADDQWQPAAATVAELEGDGRTVIAPASYEFIFGAAATGASPDVCIRYSADRREVETRPQARLLWMGDIVGNGHLSTVLLIRGSECHDLFAATRTPG